MLRKLLTPNIQRIESIRATGAVLQQILLRFRILLCRLVFAKAVSTTFHTSRLHRKNKVIIILSVEVTIQWFGCAASCAQDMKDYSRGNISVHP